MPQLWSIDQCKLVKSYQSKTFAQVKQMMENKYDLKPGDAAIPASWFSIDIKLGCLSIHLDEDTWSKCTVSELATNIQLMISMHHMDQGSNINFDVEEKDLNLGSQLF